MLKQLLSLALVLSSTTAFAASPGLGHILPRGAQRGTETVLSFTGGRLTDAKEILFYSTGFSVTKFEVVNDNTVKATVKVAADCRLGEHAARVRTATGLSELRTFMIGALPIVAEKEPNNDFATAQPIPLNVTVHGVVDNEDVDFYRFESKKGQRVTAEIEGMRLANEQNLVFDPFVAILDAKRFELAANDDAPLLGQDATASVIIPADGTYYVQVRESSYGGNGNCRYNLHVGTFPRPTAVIPAGGKPGDEVEVTFLGDAAGPFKQKVKLPASVHEKFGLFAEDGQGIAPSPIPFRLSDLPNVVEIEPNHDHQTATRAAVFPAAFNGVIAKPGEVDQFRFTAKKGQSYDVHCYARRLGSPLDSVMELAVAGGGGIIGNDDTNGPDSYFRWTVPEDKEYVLSVRDHLGKGGPNYFYRVEFQPIKPALTIRQPVMTQYSQERQTVVVPRGNRYATLIGASRAHFGGDLLFSATGLPAGLSYHAEPMPANLDTVPVVFEAAADAPVAGTLATFSAKTVDPKQVVEGNLQQSADLVIGQPGQSVYWRYSVDRAAVAVAEEAPFTIDVVEPKAPLVQNGSMSLKVVATRKAPFKGPITITMLFNPPGVNSSPNGTIPEGQTEAYIPMNAAGNAPLKAWKIVVTGVADAGKGPVWVSSKLTTLEIAAPFVQFALERGAVEQGKGTEMFGKVQVLTPFDGPAKVRLLGLPNKVTATDLDITKDTKDLSFNVAVDKTSPPGVHRNIFCQVVVQKNNEPVVASTGVTELRIDVPLPPKVAAPVAPKPVVVAAKPTIPVPPPSPAPPMEKRLTRLEKLRLEQEEREKAAKGAK